IVVVHIRDNVFRPASLSIAPDTTVRWVNEGRNRHNVTPNSGHAFGSRDLLPGQSYVHRFVAPGSFAYYCSLHGTPIKGQHAGLDVGQAATEQPASVIGDSDQPAPDIPASGRTIRVPSDAKTIQAAVNRARRGDLVLVSPGVYREAVTVATDGLVIRGLDRERTVLDGEFKRKSGIQVVGANGVVIENLTARNYTLNGFFWNGVLGYRGSYLTAYRNGDYGIYAYASQWGEFDHSYASGSPDAGYYIGQCNPCHAVITDVVAQYNQLGYSGTNSSGDIFIVRSTWTNNRAGIAPNSLSTEQLPPQGRATIAGNRVEANGSKDAPISGDGFDALYGSGIVVVGGVGDLITKNLVIGNPRVGIGIAPNPGILGSVFASSANQIRENRVSGSGLADLGILLPTVDDRNCFANNTFGTTAPAHLEQLEPCSGVGVGDLQEGALSLEQFLEPSNRPPGRDYKTTPVPPKLASMPKADSARAKPAGAPIKVDLAAITIPS
ncbi:MAG TPA: plastocyanin, partial [Acidimicrobiia bacterium]